MYIYIYLIIYGRYLQLRFLTWPLTMPCLRISLVMVVKFFPTKHKRSEQRTAKAPWFQLDPGYKVGTPLDSVHLVHL